MSKKSVADTESQALQTKLNAAIASRASLEEGFKAQSSLLIELINKLSLLSKGINITLDNRLGQFKSLLAEAAPFSEIELKIKEISTLITTQTVTNEHNIEQVHKNFHQAGQDLQKIKGLPNELRRNLRGLLVESLSTKTDLQQYIPILSQLIEFYKITLESKLNENTNSSLTELPSNTESSVNVALLEKISSCLSKLPLSTPHTNELLTLNKKLLSEETNDDVLQRFVEIFDVIVADLENERNNAKNFLDTLSDSLTTFQSDVQKTLSTSTDARDANDKINEKIQTQLKEMSTSVTKALTLKEVKTDVNGKLKNIASTIDKKAKFETKHNKILEDQLTQMRKKVEKLEEQSQDFEAKLAEQQRKTLEDALTKLSNRAAFDEFFTASIVKFNSKPFDLAIAVIDIDDFKKINDTYGHTAGDKTLQVIAKTIKTKISNDVFVARYGGEEFVLIYSNQKKDKFIEELNVINKSVARLPFKFKENKVSITLSIGATHITKEDNYHTAFERADEAMYKAKKQGKNQVIYF